MRYFVQLSYFGKNFHGWQVQPNAPSVQESLNRGMSVVLGEDVYLVGAGRTDTGVHAREMWAHFDINSEIPDNAVYRLNSFLGRDIAIRQFVKVDDQAHARFDAVERSYEYQVTLEKNPFLQDLSWQLYSAPDVAKMQVATDVLLQYEDFTAFSKTHTQTKTNICKITNATWEQEGGLLVFKISANRFLRNMVRAIVGTVVEIGQGKREPGDMTRVIESEDRKRAGESAPAQGLFLTEVKYPKGLLDGRE